jgi:hypothetical protein
MEYAISMAFLRRAASKGVFAPLTLRERDKSRYSI